MSKKDFFYIGRGCSRDHLGPHKTQKWPEKRVENEPKTGQMVRMVRMVRNIPKGSARLGPAAGTRDQGPGTGDHGPGTRDHGCRDQGPRTRAQGPGIGD